MRYLLYYWTKQLNLLFIRLSTKTNNIIRLKTNVKTIIRVGRIPSKEFNLMKVWNETEFNSTFIQLIIFPCAQINIITRNEFKPISDLTTVTIL